MAEEWSMGADLSRRRFVQVFVGVATATAVGSTLASFMGLRRDVDVPALPSASEAAAVCPVCSVGCGLRSVSSGGEAMPCRGDPASSATSGMACTRGILPPAGAWPSDMPAPLRRRSPSTKGTPPSMDQFEVLGWEEALSSVKGTLSILVDGGNGACLVDGSVPLEDCYVSAKLFKGAFRSENIDGVESIHSRASEVAYLEQLGEHGPPVCYDDVSLADLIVVVGEDIATTHPVLFAHVAEAVASSGAKLVVIDPRVTATATRVPSTHLPASAGSEVALLNSVGYVLCHSLEAAPAQWALDNSLNAEAYAEYLRLYNPDYDENERVDPQYLRDLCDGTDDWVDAMEDLDALDYLKSVDVPAVTGLAPEQVEDLAGTWAASGNVLTIWSSRLAGAGDGGLGVSSVINLHLLTGQVGRPGAGPFGLTATASGRGVYETGASSWSLPGGVPMTGASPPEQLVAAWGKTMADNASSRVPSEGVVDILEMARIGEDVGALLLVGGAVTAELPDLDGLVIPAMRKADYVVALASHLDDPDVQWADMVLPQSSWYEREAHYLSAERRVARSVPSMAAPDGLQPGHHALSLIGEGFQAGHFQYSGAATILDELRTATGGAPADMSELPLGDDLSSEGGVQWPVLTEASATMGGTARRHMGQDGRGAGFPTPSKRALIIPREHRGPRLPTSPGYPLMAVLSVEPGTWWDGQLYEPQGGEVVRSRRTAGAYVEIPSTDASRQGLSEGSEVKVSSAQGSVILPVRIAPEGAAAGHVFLPWGGDRRTQAMAPSFPRDRNGVPPWTVFPVAVELLPEVG